MVLIKYFDFELGEPSNNDFKKKFEEKIKQLDNPIFLEDQLGKIVLTSESAEKPMISFIIPISQNKSVALLNNAICLILRRGLQIRLRCTPTGLTACRPWYIPSSRQDC